MGRKNTQTALRSLVVAGAVGLAMLASEDAALLAKLQAFRKKQNETVKSAELPDLSR